MRISRIALVTALLTCFTWSANAQQPRSVRTGPGMGSGMGPAVTKAELHGDVVELPIELASTQILVDGVYVNGEGPFRFLLDTGGVGGGRVDTSLVERLGLQVTGEAIGSDGSARPGRPMAMLELRTLDVGGLHCEGVRVLSRDYNEHGRAVRGHIDGVLGFALFEDFLLTVDYGARKLRIERGALPEPNGEDVLPMRSDGVPGVEVQLAGQTHLARFDTGSMGPISVSEEIADTLELASEPVVVGKARTVTGAFEISRAKLAGDVRIGGQVVSQPDVVFGGPLRGVNIGGQVLREFVVTYDQAHDRIRLLRP
ncbi:MAG: aspartyl protease family protein [Planctomycetota bacterium]|jgi:hypothetical protein